MEDTMPYAKSWLELEDQGSAAPNQNETLSHTAKALKLTILSNLSIRNKWNL